MKDAIKPTPQPLAFQGGAATGKTQTLINRIDELLEQGTAPEEIIVFTASANSELAFRKRLAAQLDNPQTVLPIATMRTFAFDIVSSTQGCRYLGFLPRLLNPAEINVIMEDIRSTGLKQSRIKGMLGYFDRQWSELNDDEPGFIIGKDERAVLDILEGDLASMHGILEQQLSNKAVHVLLQDEQLLEGFSYKHVLVDDYQLISRASQALANLIATESIWITCDPDAAQPVYEQFPYANGIRELAKANGALHIRKLNDCHRSKAVVDALNTLRADVSMQACAMNTADDAVTGQVTKSIAPNPEAEFSHVLTLVRDAMDTGVAPGEIAVAAPRCTWCNNAAKYLENAGIATQKLPSAQALKSDIRDFHRCKTAQVVTMIDLIANPADAAAWRAWCGYGDYTANSIAFNTMRALADRKDIDIVNTLAAAEKLPAPSEESSLSLENVIKARKRGDEIIEKLQALTGTELLEGIAHEVLGPDEHVPAAVYQLIGDFDESMGAVGLHGRIVTNLWAPTFAGTDTVKVFTLDEMHGVEAKVLILCGAVNGLIPSRAYLDLTETTLQDQERLRTDYMQKIYAAFSKVSEQIHIVSSQEIDFELAERLKLHVERIHIQDGVRIATLSPSIFLEKIGE